LLLDHTDGGFIFVQLRLCGLKKGAGQMKSFIMACVAAIVIAVIGGVVLNTIQEPVDKAYTTSGVRLGA
jgi:hypothetical protein